MSVLFFCEEEVRIDDDKGSPKSCITTTSSSSFTINTSPPPPTTAQRFLKNQSFQSVGMDKKAEAALSVLHEEDSDDDDEVESQLNGSSLGSMGTLEDALPVKRGLSKFFNGKSKSFANLSDAKTIEDLKKPEIQFNKRKRILRASKSYSAVQILTSLPEEEEEEEEEEEDGTDEPGASTEPEATKKIKVDKEVNSKI